MTAQLTPAEIRDDVIAALIDQGFTRHHATWAVNLKLCGGEKFEDLFRKSLDLLQNTPTVHRGKTNGANGSDPSHTSHTSDTPALCQCGRPAKHRGRCAVRRAAAENKKHGQAPAPVLLKKQPAPQPPAPPTDPALISLVINEDQLDRFLTGLPIEAKRDLAQSWLSGNV